MGFSRVVLLVAAALAFAGCASTVVQVPSVQGKAYVVKGNVVMNCDATSGNPECWPVNEVDPEGGAK
jgi:hypothetical protein